MSLGFSAHSRGLSFMENQEHGHNFLLFFWVFLLVPRKVGMCLEVGITSLAQVRALARTDLGSLTISA